MAPINRSPLNSALKCLEPSPSFSLPLSPPHTSYENHTRERVAKCCGHSNASLSESRLAGLIQQRGGRAAGRYQPTAKNALRWGAGRGQKQGIGSIFLPFHSNPPEQDSKQRKGTKEMKVSTVQRRFSLQHQPPSPA